MTFLKKVIAGPVVDIFKNSIDPNKKYKMSKTEETWDEESRDAGDTDKKGFVYEDREFDSLWEVAEEIRNAGASSSDMPVHKSSTWSSDAEKDMHSGEDTIYTFHPELSSDKEAIALDKMVKMDQGAFKKANPAK